MALTQTNIIIAAGETLEFRDVGDFFRILKSSIVLDVHYFRNGALIVDAEGVSAGYWEKFAEPYDQIKIVNRTAGPDTISIVSRLGNSVGYDMPPVGNVAVTNIPHVITDNSVNGAFSHAQASVTNADNTILAASASRRYVLIQNNSAAAVLRVVLDGTAASATKGVRVQPGASLELPFWAATNAIRACMEIADATANNVEIVTG